MEDSTKMAVEMNFKELRANEPWWNDECEEIYMMKCEAKLRFEREPSLEASKSFRKLRSQLKKKVMYAQRGYAHQMRMSEPYPRDYPVLENQEKAPIVAKVKKKKKKRILKDDGSDSDGENFDLSKDMYPISHYISDQEELITQIFSTIKGNKLQSMLPPALKSIPIYELKNLCLHELRGMSKKRILCAINGQSMEGSSDESEEEEEESEPEPKKKEVAPKTLGKENQKSPSKEKKKTPSKSNLDHDATDQNNQGVPEYLRKTIKVENPDGGGSSGEKGGKSVLELLELQMRARIIKTMLEKGDDGKTLTEDAIVALMGNATPGSSAADINAVIKIENEDNEVTHQQENDGDRDAERKNNGEDKRHRNDVGKHGRSSRKRDHHRKKGSKRQRNAEFIESDEENEKRSRRDRNSEKRSSDKKKIISRKEFVERMKRAKKNRTYRQRKSSEDEGKAKSPQGNENKQTEKPNEKKGAENSSENKDDHPAEKEEGEALSDKEEGQAVSEKEEGEWDSNEEEEGACSPSTISSDSYYYSSSRGYSSRSHSRSYSRSYSRSPVRKRGGFRSRSRSWTRSRSRSRSNERRKRDGGSGKWSKKRSKDSGGAAPSSGNSKKIGGIVSLPGGGGEYQKKQQKEEEDNWGQSCDIEFVDSEEDFDDSSLSAADKAKKAMIHSDKKPLILKDSDRANISFSFQKKTVPSIAPNVDLDDLPLKSKSLKMSKLKQESFSIEVTDHKPDEIIQLDSLKIPSDEILISSDSENESKDPSKCKSIRVAKRWIKPANQESENYANNITTGTSKITAVLEKKTVSKRKSSLSTQEEKIKSDDQNITTGTSKITAVLERKTVSKRKSNLSIQEEKIKSDDQMAKVVDEEKQIESAMSVISVVSKQIDGEQMISGRCDPIQQDTTEEINKDDEKACNLEDAQNEDEKNGNKEKVEDSEEDNTKEKYNLREEISQSTISSGIAQNDTVMTKISNSQVSNDMKTNNSGSENTGRHTTKPDDDKLSPINIRSTSTIVEEKGEGVTLGVDIGQSEIPVSKYLGIEEQNEKNSLDMDKGEEDVTTSRDMSKKEKEVISKDINKIYEVCSISATDKSEKLGITRKKKNATSKAKDSCPVRETRSSRRKKPGQESAPQKIVLEHLQESYNEEQETDIHESSNAGQSQISNNEEHQENIQKSLTEGKENVSENPEENINPECIEKTAEYGLDVSQETSSNTAELHKIPDTPEIQDIHNEGDLHTQNQSHIQEKDDDTKLEIQVEETAADTNIEQNRVDDFYRGADQLDFSDDGKGNSDHEDIESIRKIEVEPIRIETGLIRRRVTRSKRVEMVAPEKSWTKKDKKKKEKPMGGVGLLKQTLTENMQSSSSRDDEDSQKPVNLDEGKEPPDNQVMDEDTRTSWGISSISSREDISTDSRVNTPQDLSAMSDMEGTLNPEVPIITPKKIEEETEIIGVIETSNNPDVNQMDDIDLGGSSWSMRWLQSEKVQKVVSSSKMLSRVRKKIQKKDKATKITPVTINPVVPQKKLPEPAVPIIGSIEEYERLFGMKAKNQDQEVASTSEENPQATSTVSGDGLVEKTPEPEKKSATFGSDDDGEDSEEEALWSKIIGK